MPDTHEADVAAVAAVLAEVIRHGSGESIDNAVDDLLAALTAAGYAVVKVSGLPHEQVLDGEPPRCVCEVCKTDDEGGVG